MMLGIIMDSITVNYVKNYLICIQNYLYNVSTRHHWGMELCTASALYITA